MPRTTQAEAEAERTEAKKQYKILQSVNPGELQAAVQREIDAGWTPAGGVAAAYGKADTYTSTWSFYQAIVR